MSAPSFIQEAESAWTTTLGVGVATRDTGSFNVLANDVLVAFAISEDHGSVGNLTISGGSLTWTEQQTHRVTNNVGMTLATAIVDSDKSMFGRVTRADTTGIRRVGINVLTFRGSDGVGASSKEQAIDGGAGTEPSLNITTTRANSVVVVANGDWAAQDGTTRTWRTGAGSLTEVTYDRTAGIYTAYGGYHPDVGAAAVKAVGLSLPVSQTYSIAAVEVFGMMSALTMPNRGTRPAPFKPGLAR